MAVTKDQGSSEIMADLCSSLDAVADDAYGERNAKVQADKVRAVCENFQNGYKAASAANNDATKRELTGIFTTFLRDTADQMPAFGEGAVALGKSVQLLSNTLNNTVRGKDREFIPEPLEGDLLNAADAFRAEARSLTSSGVTGSALDTAREMAKGYRSLADTVEQSVGAIQVEDYIGRVESKTGQTIMRGAFGPFNAATNAAEGIGGGDLSAKVKAQCEQFQKGYKAADAAGNNATKEALIGVFTNSMAGMAHRLPLMAPGAVALGESIQLMTDTLNGTIKPDEKRFIPEAIAGGLADASRQLQREAYAGGGPTDEFRTAALATAKKIDAAAEATSQPTIKADGPATTRRPRKTLE